MSENIMYPEFEIRISRKTDDGGLVEHVFLAEDISEVEFSQNFKNGTWKLKAEGLLK